MIKANLDILGKLDDLNEKTKTDKEQENGHNGAYRQKDHRIFC